MWVYVPCCRADFTVLIYKQDIQQTRRYTDSLASVPPVSRGKLCSATRQYEKICYDMADEQKER